MAKDLVLHLRYLGMSPRSGHREYRFLLEAPDKSVRTVALTIDNRIFLKRMLMFQEAPDLCYQKMLADMTDEFAGARICGLAAVTETEIARYRESHPASRLSGRKSSRQQV